MLYRAIVRDNRDPASKGRLKVTIPTLSGDAVSDWIWPVVSSGYVVKPKAGQQVWVTFENGDRETPVWVGKTDVTATGSADTTRGYATLLERVETLETQVVALQGQVSSLTSRVYALEHP